MKNINFVKNKKYFFIFTIVCVVLGIACMLIRGFNVDTDFAGGTNMHIRIHEGTELTVAELDEIRAVVEPIIGGKVASIQKTGGGGDVMIKTKELSSEVREAVFAALSEKYGLTDEALQSVTNVGASMSADLRRSAIISTAIAVALMLCYIAFRFQVTSALAAVTCLVHDLFFMLAAYSLLQIPMQSTMIAALLTILGYSINATIIIFDNIRERRKDESISDEDNVNNSIRSTMTRSINTTITTLLTIGMVYLFGVDSIKDFALPLIIGIFAGLYSSVCLAGNIWLVYEKHLGKYLPKKKKKEPRRIEQDRHGVV
ncbi:MAG: protein translocase subunit SecF [Clostridia bacterium]|nr:protein translocase subunit SecF [Clostridia bacterium]